MAPGAGSVERGGAQATLPRQGTLTAPLPSPRRSRRERIRRGALFTIALVVGLGIVVPILFGVISGFKDPAQMQSNPLGLPSPWNFSNYTDILGGWSFWRSTFNSLFIAAATVILVVGSAALAAFIFARYAFRGREVLFMFFAAGLMFPPAVAVLPLFVLLRQLGLLGSPWGVILPQAAFGLPLTIIILRTFFRSIPPEIEESAILDGCTTFGVFWRVMLPMAKPALAVVGVLALVTSWNNFLLPLLVLIGERDWWTLPLGVNQFSGQFGQDTARVLAYTMLAMVPALAFFFVAERQIVAGIAPTAGSKG
ncbi:carbohydrate ABC transporter permease [Natronosporangium hydrolyticum]|uniref:Carbohydrate ABC transporter permease n=2 Tax=Natronosporangium hydrolyticum TaxID=2811111 RepID=A0A895YPC1_9ACTN|nr:carbohydrate ABC transporter permease [Natronosporangium hydrolyticum]